MSAQRTGDERTAATGPPPAPADVVQHLVDRAAHFNLFSLPDPSVTAPAILGPGRSPAVIGVHVREVLHRFRVASAAPTSRCPLRSSNIVGEAAGTFSHRWLMTPSDFVSAPGLEPPPTPFDPSRSQRFVMLDSICRFGDGRDGFRGFGTGQTFPSRGQPQLLAMAVGVITDGFGTFRGLEEGTYVYCGSLTPARGFVGDVMLRVIDQAGIFRTERELPDLHASLNPEPDITYIVFRGQAVPSDAVTERIGSGGRPIGLKVQQGMRLLDLDFHAGGSGLRTFVAVGPLIGRITAHVTFNPTAPGGTALAPIPFTSVDEFDFFDQSGRSVGGFTADSSEGRVFHTSFSGQQGIRFGGIGRILSGTGTFAGIDGLMTDNSVVVFAPHVSASVYVLRVHDPQGRFRTAVSRASASHA
jgi:hypothetical protein